MQNPLELAPEQLRQLSPDTLDRYARGATGALTRIRVFLGRVLVAMDDTDAHDHFGCHSSAHYAETVLRMDEKFAHLLRRIAIRLEGLPRVSEAVENGSISWSNLRAILPFCEPHNEAEWLRRAQQLTSRELEEAIRFEQGGGSAADPRSAVELTFHVSPETAALLEWACRDLCREAGRRMKAEELLEALCAERLAGAPFPSESAWTQMRQEVARDLQAQAAHRHDVATRAGLIEQDLASAQTASEQNRWSVPSVDQTSEAISARVDSPFQLHVDPALSSAAEPLRQNPIFAPPFNTWDAVVATETPCPGAPQLTLVGPAPGWQNGRLRFNPRSRLLTEEQRREILRRDGYRCSTPGCSHTLWLHTHHIVFYSEGGLTIPSNLVTICSACHRTLHEGHLFLKSGPRGLTWSNNSGRSLVQFCPQVVPGWLEGWVAAALMAA